MTIQNTAKVSELWGDLDEIRDSPFERDEISPPRFAYIDQDEWKSNILEKGGAKDQMKRRKKAQIVKLV